MINLPPLKNKFELCKFTGNYKIELLRKLHND